MDCKITAGIILVFALKIQAQPLTVNELAWPTNGASVSSVPNIPPTAIGAFYAVPLNPPSDGTIIVSNVMATDPQGLVLKYSVDALPSGTLHGPGADTPNHVNPAFFYEPLTFSQDLFQWHANNGVNSSAVVTTVILEYPTNVPTTLCSANPYTGNAVYFQFPVITNISYFFTLYTQGAQFSNAYFWQSNGTVWSQVTTPNQYPTFFNTKNGSILFPSSLNSITVCANDYVSNSPCTMVPPTNVWLTVLTNSQNTLTLPGTTPVYSISTSPTNGYFTNLNTSTGQVTYVETNSSASVDYAQYCTSNSPTCVLCAPVYVNIADSFTCGQCFTAPSQVGGVVTGDIFFNTGIPNEEVCIYHTNELCVISTNCATTDNNGNVSFFVHFCPGSSRYCIISLETCTGVCGFSSATLGGIQYNGDCIQMNGTYALSSGAVDIAILTNTTIASVGGCSSSVMWYYPNGLDDLGIGVPQYAILWINFELDAAAMYTTNPASCATGAITNWILTSTGTNFYSLPSISTISGTLVITNCTPICP